MKIIPEPLSFDWDKGNQDKNYQKHKVSSREAEEVFGNKPLFIIPDRKHSSSETRYLTWGKINSYRLLTIIFTVRNNKLRIISARNMNKKERGAYEK